ncbi:MAG: ABC transporter ATP-binding protein/permease [Planctomycetes bacterium]|nr:ABC transporter ATP-binding protein/permease [Planctomycetota bacterium]
MNPTERPGWRTLLSHARRHWRTYALGVAALALVDAVDGIAVPWLTGAAFANLEREPDLRVSTAMIGAAFAFAALIQLGMRYAWRHFFIRTADRVGSELRTALFSRLQALPLSFFDRSRSGDLVSRMTNDMNDVRTAAGSGFLLAADAALYLLFVVPQLLWISPGLSAVALLFVPLVLLLVRWGGRVVHARSAAVQERIAALSARLQESFAGARVVKAFAIEPGEELRFQALARDYQGAQVHLARFQAGYAPSLGMVFDLANVLVLGLGAREVLNGRLTLAELVVYTRAFDKVVWPMMAIGMVTGMLQRGAAAQARIDEVLTEPPDPAATDPGAPAEEGPRLAGGLSVRGLTFRYPGADPARPPALDGVSFDAPPGALVGVVGPVGAGKSTLLSLIARLHEPPAGAVLLDGHDVRDLPPATLRRHVAVVPQEAFLFSATIAENVAFGRQAELGPAAIEEACRAAHVDPEVRALDGGYGALLGERGVNLSGGQRQRLTIARALVRAPAVLLLDDALSAVDAETEAGIARAVRERSGPTRVVVTHRLSAVRSADLIVVLDRGRVVARGTHDALMAEGGLYARLARAERLEEEAARLERALGEGAGRG